VCVCVCVCVRARARAQVWSKIFQKDSPSIGYDVIIRFTSKFNDHTATFLQGLWLACTDYSIPVKENVLGCSEIERILCTR